MNGPTIVISPAPTANGDLHLGHIAGPFLAADVYTRYARAVGREVLFGSGVQDTSTFVTTTAHRLGTTPEALIRRSAKEVEATLGALGIAVDGFTGWEPRFTTFVARFVRELYDLRRLEPRPMTFPYLPHTGEFLVDGHVAGACPVCLEQSCAGLCEGCGHPVAAAELLDPRSTRYPDEPLEFRTAVVLVLPLERYRVQLRAHFAGSAATLRPHAARLLAELLGSRLPDFPVTYPISWGIPVQGGEFGGQVINPNAETAAWTMYCATVAAERRGGNPDAEDALCRRRSGARIAYFLGADNIYPFAVVAPALLLAHGDRYALPKMFLTNEFYELDHEKFSTSRGHVVWGRELAARVPRDLIRFHLADDSPEFQRTSFNERALAERTGARLVDPWNRVADKVDAWAGRGPLAVSARARELSARIVERFTAAYELPGFSLNRVARTVTRQLIRLAATTEEGGDFCQQVDVVLRCAAPILIDLANVLPDTAITGAADRTHIEPLRLPRLSRVGG
ncbi:MULTISPECIES: class I tRNA ligase family protein [unclassified Nocardia]|uniref:class I tRNA ligase family protein n=1 Tax=unclassified Nocardia TaxID=2637762 RepID=UPI001CE479C0|nr:MULTISPECIES: class I tRNA ligase family protein [unclassified Nocardia]